MYIFVYQDLERSGSVVRALDWNQRVAGSILTTGKVTMLCP